MGDKTPYSQEIRAEAIAVVWQTRNYHEAARVMAERYPERHPDVSQIYLWTKHMAPEWYTTIQRERQANLQSQWADTEALALERMQHDILTGEIKGQGVAITAGISADKRLKAKEIEARGGRGDTFNILALIEQNQSKLSPDDIAKLEGRVSDHEVLEGTVKEKE